MTRRGGDETSFGLIGRVVVTAVVASGFLALVAFTVAAQMIFLVPTAVIPGGVLCAWILKETWRAVPADGTVYRAPVKLADIAEAVRPPSFRSMTPGRRVVVLAAIAGCAVFGVLPAAPRRAGRRRDVRGTPGCRPAGRDRAPTLTFLSRR
jgi:hypothetical protein